jgi:hypothetical protein
MVNKLRGLLLCLMLQACMAGQFINYTYGILLYFYKTFTFTFLQLISFLFFFCLLLL